MQDAWIFYPLKLSWKCFKGWKWLVLIAKEHFQGFYYTFKICRFKLSIYQIVKIILCAGLLEFFLYPLRKRQYFLYPMKKRQNYFVPPLHLLRPGSEFFFRNRGNTLNHSHLSDTHASKMRGFNEVFHALVFVKEKVHETDEIWK